MRNLATLDNKQDSFVNLIVTEIIICLIIGGIPGWLNLAGEGKGSEQFVNTLESVIPEDSVMWLLAWLIVFHVLVYLLNKFFFNPNGKFKTIAQMLLQVLSEVSFSIQFVYRFLAGYFFAAFYHGAYHILILGDEVKGEGLRYFGWYAFLFLFVSVVLSGWKKDLSFKSS